MLLCSSMARLWLGCGPIYDVWGQVKWTRSLPSAGTFNGTLHHIKTESPTVEGQSPWELLEVHVLHHSDP